MTRLLFDDHSGKHRSLKLSSVQALGSLGLLLISCVSISPFSSASEHTPPVGIAETEADFEEDAETDLEPSVEPGLEFAGEFEVRLESLKNITLGERPRDDVRFSEQELQLGFSYRRHRLLAFGEIKGLAEQAFFADDTPRLSEAAFERGEMWLLFKRVLGGHYAVQMGRQNFSEPRLWWWDDDLDAVRLYYTRAPWSLYVGLAEELGRVSTNEDFIDPENDDIRRLLGHISWTPWQGFNLGGFLLAQNDDSGSPAVDSVVSNSREDAIDADLRWAGLRAAGAFGWPRYGRLRYRTDIAVVTGEEILLEFEDDEPGFSRVTETQKRNVHGWAVDIGTSWALPLSGDPTLTLGYAYGSGDSNLTDNTDRMFRQTGLQDQDETFRDYGVVLRPELSNLRIITLALGLPVHTATRLILGHHRFRQVDAAPFLRNTGIDAEPTGESKDIGEEISLVLQLRYWENPAMDLIAGRFEAGPAYGAGAGEHTHRVFFKLIYEF